MTETKRQITPRYSSPRKMGTDFVNAKYCVFTAWVHKHPADWKPTFNAEKMSYLIYQLEECPTSKQRHFQGYVEFNKSTRREAARLALSINIGGWNALNRKGSTQENIIYCSKAESRITPHEEFGEPSHPPEHKGRGNRTDLSDAMDLIDLATSKKKAREAIIEQYPSVYARYSNGIEKVIELKKMIVPPKIAIELLPWQQRLMTIIHRGFVKRQIIWIWSKASGTGKSTFQDYLVGEMGMDAVLTITKTKWEDMLCAYEEHKVIIINFARDHKLHDTDLEVLENTSDGGVKTSGKYMSRQKLLQAVVLCFANQPPPESRLPKRFITECIDPPEADAAHSED